MYSGWLFLAAAPTGLGTLQEGAMLEPVLDSVCLGAQQLFAEGTAPFAVSVVGWLGTLPRVELS